MTTRVIYLFTYLLICAILLVTDDTKTYTTQDFIFYFMYLAFLYNYYKFMMESLNAKK